MNIIGSLSKQHVEKEAWHLLNQRQTDQRFKGGNGKSKAICSHHGLIHEDYSHRRSHQHTSKNVKP